MNIFHAFGKVIDSGSNAMVTGCNAVNKICQMVDDVAQAGRVQTQFLTEISEEDVKVRRIEFKARVMQAEAKVKEMEKELEGKEVLSRLNPDQSEDK